MAHTPPKTTCRRNIIHKLRCLKEMYCEINYLSTDPSLLEPVEVCVGPLALAPGRDVSQVVGEVHSVELVVDKLPDVPRKVVVPKIYGTSEWKQKEKIVKKARKIKMEEGPDKV